MLAVAVESNNVYYRLGLIHLIEQISQVKPLDDYQILPQHVPRLSETANIIFTENAAIINSGLHNNSSGKSPGKAEHGAAFYLTFNAAGLFIEDACNFISRIFTAAGLILAGMDQREFYRSLKVRKNAQLSDAEKRLVMLSGYGHDIVNISRIMHCSPNSSYTYRRNAMKKLGMDNRLQFYKYVQVLARFKQHNNIFICL